MSTTFEDQFDLSAPRPLSPEAAKIHGEFFAQYKTDLDRLLELQKLIDPLQTESNALAAKVYMARQAMIRAMIEAMPALANTAFRVNDGSTDYQVMTPKMLAPEPDPPGATRINGARH